jgi:hypothetical protein
MLFLIARIRDTIVSCGGIESVVMSMKNYPHDAEIQEQAAGALWNFALDGKYCLFNEYNRTAFSIIVTSYSCNYLRNFIISECRATTRSNYYFQFVDRNKKLISDLNGIHYILRALKRFSFDANVVECCCGALQNLTLNGKFTFILINSPFVLGFDK